MEPELKCVEVKPMRSGNHDLAVQHAVVRQVGKKRLAKLREVAIERPQVAALNEEVGLMAEDNRAKPIPLRLVKKSASSGSVSASFASMGSTGGAIANRRRCLRLVHGNGCIKDRDSPSQFLHPRSTPASRPFQQTLHETGCGPASS